MPIAAVIKGQTYAIHSDHLNTPRKLTQPDGQVAWQWAYSAFGDEQPTIGAKRFTSESTNPTTGATSIPEVTFNLRYPGQYFDKETKLHYNYFRDYEPQTGRYIQSDPIGLDGGWNRFGYVDGNPLSFIDPEGLLSTAACANPANAAACAAAGVGAIGAGGAITPGGGRGGHGGAAGSGSSSSGGKSDQINDPDRSKRGEARCRCKAATNAEGSRGPTPQQWFYAERSGPTMAEAAREACRQANKHIGEAFPGCQGEHCHCVCSDNGGPPVPYNPR